MKADVLVSLGAAQLAGDVVDGIIVHTSARRPSATMRFNVFVRGWLSTGHFNVMTRALDSKTGLLGPAGRADSLLRSLGSRSSPSQVNQLVTGR